jgi:hypothetical protein
MVSVTRLFLCLLAMLTGMPVAQAAVPGQSAPVAQGAAEQQASVIPAAPTAVIMAHAPHSHLIEARAFDPSSTGCGHPVQLAPFAIRPPVHRSDRARE